MDTNTKSRIIAKLQDYAKEKGLNKRDLSKMASVSESYIHCMMNGQLCFKETEIGEVHFKKVAKVIGFNIGKVYWVHQDTPQYVSIYSKLLDAKISGRTKMMIGKTSIGKTYTINSFKQKVPANTFVITVSNLHTWRDIMEELCLCLNISCSGSSVACLKRIKNNLQANWLFGKKPIVIFDEAENMLPKTLKSVKTLYDAVGDICSIVLIGTEQLEHKLDELFRKKEIGIPQFVERFRAGKSQIGDIDKDEWFPGFLSLIKDENVREFIYNLSDNYRVLHNYVSHALMAADQMEVPLTEEFFRKLNDL